jgi:hypothetical protein
MYIFDQSDHDNRAMNIVEVFRSKYQKKTGIYGGVSTKREINVASNGINYYQLLLEGSVQSSKIVSDPVYAKYSRKYSSASITEV